MMNFDTDKKNTLSISFVSESTGFGVADLISLCESGELDCSIMNGKWYVHSDLATVGKSVKRIFTNNHEFITSAEAAKISGYTQDYVGQLARSGAILAKKNGRKWLVDRDALLVHKKNNDEMLARVQVQSVGINRDTSILTKRNIDEGEYLHKDIVITPVKKFKNSLFRKNDIESLLGKGVTSPMVLSRYKIPKVSYYRTRYGNSAGHESLTKRDKYSNTIKQQKSISDHMYANKRNINETIVNNIDNNLDTLVLDTPQVRFAQVDSNITHTNEFSTRTSQINTRAEQYEEVLHKSRESFLNTEQGQKYTYPFFEIILYTISLFAFIIMTFSFFFPGEMHTQFASAMVGAEKYIDINSLKDTFRIPSLIQELFTANKHINF